MTICKEHGEGEECVQCVYAELAESYRVDIRMVRRLAGCVRRELERVFRGQMQTSLDVTERLRYRVAEYQELSRYIRERIGRDSITQGQPSLEVICDAVMYPVTIYGLIASCEPERIRYVGQTLNPVSRLKSHIAKGSPKMAKWVRECRDAGTLIRMLRIESTVEELSLERERHWIGFYRSQGMADLNAHDASRLLAVVA